MNAEQIAKALGGASKSSTGWWNARCPSHADQTASLGLHDTEDGGVAYRCMAGCDKRNVGDALRAQGLLPDRERPRKRKRKRGKHTATYRYVDEHGATLFEVWRYADPKDFAQRKPDASEPGGWKWSLGDVRRVLFRLPELIAADPAQTVFVCEGEKDVLRLASLGLIATTSAQGAKSWAKTDSKILTSRHVVLLPDADTAGREYVLDVARDLVNRAASVRILDLQGLPPKGDVSDWLDQGHTVDELRELATAAPLFVDDEPSWRKRLLTTSTGRAYDVMHNAAVILREDPDLIGRLRWNRLLAAVEGRQLPWRPNSSWEAWTDADDLLLTLWMQERGLLIKQNTVAAAVQAVARDAPVHPILDRLNALQWDGTPRLDGWLRTYLGVRDDGDEGLRNYHCQVGRKFLISAVARIDRPGIQADHALIFEGAQGAGKSATAAALALDPSWFTDDIRDLGTKDSAQDLRGKWIVELAELSALKRAELERIKSFISRRVDHYRPSYGRRSEDFGRQCVFIGSTNASSYLVDETGGRRFWPVKIGRIDLAALHRDVEQLWAEAVAAYRAGERWWLDKATEAIATEEQRARHQPDAWEDAILGYLLDKASVMVPQVLEHVIKIPLERQDQIAWNRVARVLVANGWGRKRRRINGSRAWVYVRIVPETEPESGDTGDGVGTKKPANTPMAPLSPVSPLGFVHRENGQTANDSVHSFAHDKNVGRASGSGDSGDPPPKVVPCEICGSPVEIGKSGHALTSDGHVHVVCLIAADTEDGESVAPLPH